MHSLTVIFARIGKKLHRSMVDVYQEPAVGMQFSSLKSSRPFFSIPHATRTQREKLHLSHEHDKTSPHYDTPGPVYELPSTVGTSAAFSFGTGPQRHVHKSQSLESSIDLLGSFVDDQHVKYHKTKTALFGTDTRENIKNAVILKHHPQAFYGKQSPGPAGYSLPEVIGREGSMITMGSKTKVLAANCQTPDFLGPGSYPLPTTCGGSQFLSRIPNQPVFSFGKGQQRPEPSERLRSMSQPVLRDSFSVNSIGNQVDSTKRSAGKPVMGSQTREQWAKMALVFAVGDKRVSTQDRIVHPMLPYRHEVIKWSS